ncbi:Oidioi.mRNA.OKI2018_I69.chr1.g2188.t1.cds [Oikopleura dioica]|uniref:Oidioi.mRNA.OKI2018_I69.chr1.g2188.t1.cds n=1 Tax=Oikopleura dioica TaxID=34765 RepID=A0ABN7SQW8_OIKDI|nr:Oidioi.mRNA.OKI2018_I69.chr1.g2188.t1.cds [Oikopleura dioica]
MSSTEDSEENVLMLQPPLENSESVSEVNEYHSERKRSVYGPKGLGKLIRLNLSGMEYKTWSSTLEHYPDTLLGNAKTRKYFFHDETNEYYFERNRESFPAILYFYQSQGIELDVY